MIATVSQPAFIQTFGSLPACVLKVNAAANSASTVHLKAHAIPYMTWWAPGALASSECLTVIFAHEPPPNRSPHIISCNKLRRSPNCNLQTSSSVLSEIVTIPIKSTSPRNFSSFHPSARSTPRSTAARPLRLLCSRTTAMTQATWCPC